jgi:hypothetical protein
MPLQEEPPAAASTGQKPWLVDIDIMDKDGYSDLVGYCYIMWVSVPGYRNSDNTAIILMIWVNYNWLVVFRQPCENYENQLG